MAQQFPSDFPQSQFQQPAPFPNTPQRSAHFPQQQIPPHLYQQFQQQQQQQQQQPSGFIRPGSRENLALSQGQSQRYSPHHQNNRPQSAISQGNAPNTPIPQRQAPAPMQHNIMQQSPAGAQAAQANHPAQTARNAMQQQPAPTSPQAAAREEERVTTLLEINSHLLQEVMNLQAQGKAGPTSQQSPTSPGASADNANMGSNSPNDPSKSHPPSQEYADCMRRLQANLAFLAAIADASRKATGNRPMGPAIMVPPPHLTTVHPLYQKLGALFPEASQTTLNKAMAVANAQRAAAHVQAQG